MSNAGEYRHAHADPRVPLLNLESVRTRMDTLQRFLSESVNTNTLLSNHQMSMVSTEISSAIQQIILNGAALLASSTTTTTTTPPSEANHHQPPEPPKAKRPKYPSKEESVTVIKEEEEEEGEEGRQDPAEMDNVVELDAVELLAEHVHFCEVCGKGFKRDANLRMHMRAHGNQFKTPEALSKPDKGVVDDRKLATRFSCPYEGCNRNKKHKKFWPLKSVICVRNHFKRSHCPKMYSCDRCHKKSFSILADLKSHLKHCGESRWKCSCGTSFSRKDKLFGHMALFEGHMPAVVSETEAGVGVEVEVEAEEQVDREGEEEVMAAAAAAAAALKEEGPLAGNFSNGVVDDEFFEGLLFDGFTSTIDGFSLQDVLMGSPSSISNNNSISNSFWGSGFGVI